MGVERLLVSSQALAVVVEREGSTIDWVQRGEGGHLFLVWDEGLVSANDHENRGVLDCFVHVAGVRLH